MNPSKPGSRVLLTGLGCLLVIRMLLSLLPSYTIDMNGYTIWSQYLANQGFKDFYRTYHVVYAPAYIYLLWITGKLSLLLSAGPVLLELLVKMWAVFSDIIGGCLIYSIAAKHKKDNLGIILGILYILNPGVFFNSSVWGQFDSIPATLLLAVIYLFLNKKHTLAILVFASAVLTKPQSGLLAPILLAMIFREFNLKNTLYRLKLVYSAIGGICLYIMAVVPFYYPTPLYKDANPQYLFEKIFYSLGDVFYWMYYLYRKSLDDYPYATANAFNLWTLLGGQAVFDGQRFIGISYSAWGLLLSFGVAAYCIYLVLKKRTAFMLYFASFLTLSGFFLFATRMHERYLLPAIIFITVCSLWDKSLLIPMSVLSLCILVNHWYIYDMARRGTIWISRYDTVALVTAGASLAVFLFCAFKGYRYAVEDVQAFEKGIFIKL